MTFFLQKKFLEIVVAAIFYGVFHVDHECLVLYVVVLEGICMREMLGCYLHGHHGHGKSFSRYSCTVVGVMDRTMVRIVNSRNCDI